MVWPSNSILWIPPTAMEHPPGKVPKKNLPYHIGFPMATLDCRRVEICGSVSKLGKPL